MSQTETLMLVALGFALALVMVLLFGRAVWGISMRIGARNQERQIPTAMLALQADRDRLRADHAMMSRKIELRLEDIKSRMTEQMAEVSRHRNRVQTMQQDLLKRDETLQIRDREIGTLTAQLETCRTDLAACYDKIEKMTSESSLKDAQLAKQIATTARKIATSRDLSIADKTFSGAPIMPLYTKPSLPSSNEPAESRLMQRVAELTSITSQMSNQLDSISGPRAPAIERGEYATDNLNPDPVSRPETFDQQLQISDQHGNPHLEPEPAVEIAILPDAVAQPPIKKAGPMANVISIAQRLRSLQRGSD